MRGSCQYVKQMTPQEKANTVLMVNLDSVAGGDMLNVYSGGHLMHRRADLPWSPELSARQAVRWPRQEVFRFAKEMGIKIQTSPGLNPHLPAGQSCFCSDHAPFRWAGIPYLYFEATNWYIGNKDGWIATRRAGELWHTRNDTLAFINREWPGRLHRQLAAVVEMLQRVLTTPIPAHALLPGGPSVSPSGSPSP